MMAEVFYNCFFYCLSIFYSFYSFIIFIPFIPFDIVGCVTEKATGL